MALVSLNLLSVIDIDRNPLNDLLRSFFRSGGPMSGSRGLIMSLMSSSVSSVNDPVYIA